MDKRILCKRMKGLLSLILALGMMLIPSQTALAREYVIENSEIVVGQTLVVGDFFKSNLCNFSASGIYFYVYIDGVEILYNNTAYYNNGGFYLAGEDGKEYYVTEYTNTGSIWDRDWIVTLRLSATPPPTTSDPKPTKIEEVHKHSYSWVTVQEATTGQDGIEEYRCSCGDVAERSAIPASQVFVKGLYGEVKNAPLNGTVTFDSGRQYTMSDYIVKKLAERSDVTTVVTFEYNKIAYRMTIPAGADYSALLADEDYFCGYFYFAKLVGATIEEV